MEEGGRSVSGEVYDGRVLEREKERKKGRKKKEKKGENDESDCN